MPLPRQTSRSALALRGVPISATPAAEGEGYVLQSGVWVPNALVLEGDSRLSDARTPTAHAASHASGQSDALKLDDLAAPDDNTDLNATASAHGLLPKLSGDSGDALLGDGTWGAVGGGGGGVTPYVATDVPVANAWWIPRDVVGTNTSTLHNADTLYAIYWSCFKGTIDQLGVNISTAVGGATARIGLYLLDPDTGYPADLLGESGDLDASSTGPAGSATGLGIVVPADGYLGWALNLSNTGIGVNVASSFAAVGRFWVTGVGYGIQVASPYGTPPATFPAGGSPVTLGQQTWIPLIRYSAVG